MTEPLVYAVDGRTYLDRQNRARAMIDELHRGDSVDTADWSRRMGALHLEVEPLDLVVGARYRVRLLAGPPETHHHHGRDPETGELYGIDLPAVGEVDYTELEGIFVGRMPDPPYPQGGIRGSIILDVAGMAAVFADVDVLRLEEIR